MKTRSLTTLVAIVSITFAGVSITNAQQSTESEMRLALEKLLIQRRDTLKQRVDVMDQMYASGQLSFTEVLAAKGQLLDAELGMADTSEQRVTLYEKRVENMRVLEKMLEERFETGQVTLESTLSATAARLQSEIDLMREKL